MNSLLKAYFTWTNRKATSVTEDVNPVYDEMFPYHPEYIHRYLPAAFNQVRENDDMKDLEYRDKDAFKRQVANAAFLMHKLSSQDKGTWNQEISGEMQAESLQESYQDGHVRHIRAFQSNKGDNYIVSLDEKVFNNVTSSDILRLIGNRMDIDVAVQLIEKLKKVGELIYDEPIHNPTEELP